MNVQLNLTQDIKVQDTGSGKLKQKAELGEKNIYICLALMNWKKKDIYFVN